MSFKYGGNEYIEWKKRKCVRCGYTDFTARLTQCPKCNEIMGLYYDFQKK